MTTAARRRKRFLFTATAGAAWLLVSATVRGGETNAAYGTLRLGSRPVRCVVRVGGNRYAKDRPVLEIGDLVPGRYEVIFKADGRTVAKSVEVRAGEATVVFGNLGGSLATARPAGGAISADDADAGARTSSPDEAEDGHPIEAALLENEPRVVPRQRHLPSAPPSEPEPARFGGRPVPPEEKAGGIPAESPRGERIRDADDTFDHAQTLRMAMNPVVKSRRYREAARLYRKILQRWPASDKVEACHYWLGMIEESVYRRDYRAAIAQYEAVLETNPHTTFDARWRIAELYDNNLKEHRTARTWYEKAARESPEASIREKAARKVEQLREWGF